MTASEVVDFQLKYKSEILTPFGLKNGTGFVGKSTRAKLNKLYGCEGGTQDQINYTADPISNIILGETYKFSAKIKNAPANSPVYFYLQRPDGSFEYNGVNTDFLGQTNASGNWNRNITQTLPVQGQTGKYASWFVVGGITSNTIYHYVTGSISSQKPSITVLSPNGGEKWSFGETHNITWKSSYSSNDKIKIVLNTKSGSPVKIITQNLSDIGFYSWYIDSSGNAAGFQMPAGDYLIEMCKGNVCDESNNYFSIVAAATTTPIPIPTPTPVTPSITVLWPNGGDIDWKTGFSVPIKWSAQNIDNIIINIIDYSYSSELFRTVAKGVSATQGNYIWTIPQDFFKEGWKSGDNFKIFIAELKSNGAYGIQDESDNYFSIEQAISYPGFFMATDKQSYSSGDAINLKVSRADNKTFTYFVDLYLVKQSDNSKTLFYQNFNVTGPTSVQIPTLYSGTFTASGNYTLLICAAGEVCGSGTNTNSTAVYYNYTPTPSITVFSPSGGQITKGANIIIDWKHTAPTDHKFGINLLQTNNGNLAANIKLCNTVSNITQELGRLYYNWNAGYDAYGNEIQNGNYKILVYDCAGITVSGESINSFELISPSIQPSITVTSPNGSENWEAGHVQKIIWTSNGVNSVWLSYLKYPDTTGTTASQVQITSLSNNPGFYDWSIPTNISTSSYYKIQVASLDGAVSDLSDNYFKIIPNADLGFNNIENQMASISAAVTKLVEQIKELKR
ncbi:MAG: hypothetical protein AAB451_01695 [Patescibacteria group bacterium]